MLKDNPEKEKKSIIDYNILIYCIPISFVGQLVGGIIYDTFPMIIALTIILAVNIIGIFLFSGKLQLLKQGKPKQEILLSYLVPEENIEFERVFNNSE